MTLQHPHAELSAYIDGELIPAARAAVEGHLAACGTCTAHVAQLRATAAFVHALPDPVPSRRLVPRLTTVPAWLAPLRTIMTLASGTAVFLFIASSLVSNITFLAGSGAATLTSAGRDSAAQAGAPAAGALPASTTSPGAVAENTAFAASSAPQVAGATRALGTATPDDATKARADQATTAPVAPGAVAPQDLARNASLEPQRSPLLNPWLWLALALLFGATAIVIQRRLHASV